MKNKIYKIVLIIVFLFTKQTLLIAEELNVKSSLVKVNKDNQIIILEKNVEAFDKKKNKIYSEFAEYNKKIELFETRGVTKIITSEGYIVDGTDILFDNKKKIISSSNFSTIIDKEGNKIELEMFNYLIDKNLFFSKGKINFLDINKNDYQFSEVYIDEKKNKIVGTDAKIFLNDDSTKVHEKNEPRLFANTVTITEDSNIIEKGVFTYCKNRGEDKCPPWQIRARQIEHSPSTKTIYYKDALVKVYDFPIFYFPRFSHPDPSVKRRSGFLIPTLASNSNVGSSFNAPYFWSIAKDKDLTITPKLYFRENPLMLAEYRQDFKNSFLVIDSGYTSGYKKQTTTKTDGSRAHFFSKFNMDLFDGINSNKNIELNIQQVTNDTYLKVHSVDTNLVDSEQSILENSLDFNYDDEDSFLGITVAAFNNLGVVDNSKYEYLYPTLTFDKNLLADDRYGIFDLTTKLEVKNYQVDKHTEFFTNDINWRSNKFVNNLGFQSNFQGLLRGAAYKAKETNTGKNDNINSSLKENKEVAQLSGALGYLTKLNLYKNNLKNGTGHLLTPKIFLRYGPGTTRNISGVNNRLRYENLYAIDKLKQLDVLENGMSASIGFDYKKNKINKNKQIEKEVFSFAAGQVINEKENKDLPTMSSLNQRFSDFVGDSKFVINEESELKYKFAVDQNYKTFTYNEIGADLKLGLTKFNMSYLQEKLHVGNREFVEAGVNYEFKNSNQLSFSTKRNLLTNSAEFYNLSYDYINDCLKAALVFRREFYTDRDVEPNNSLMFTISLVPFANINSPNLQK